MKYILWGLGAKICSLFILQMQKLVCDTGDEANMKLQKK